MKKDSIKVIVLVIIAAAAFYEYFVCDVSFLLGGMKKTLMKVAQVINLGIIIMGAFKVDEFIDWLFKKKKEGA